jgi:cell wall-associated NlpC family hydrolase
MPAAIGARWRPRNLIAIALLALAALAAVPADHAGASAYGGISAVSPEPPAATPQPPATSPGVPGRGPVSRAALVGGRAIPPLDAPAAVRKAIQAANRIRTKPYVWGGGHGRWWDNGYDCSGSVSYALHGAGLLGVPMVSGSLAHWGEAGPGRWITIYANAGHVYATIAGLRWDTSGNSSGTGPRWHEDAASPAGFTVRHPPGY